VAPLIFAFNGNDYTQDEYYLIKINTTNVNQTIGYIQNTWNNVFKGNPFTFSFMDEYLTVNTKASFSLSPCSAPFPSSPS